MAHSVTMKLSAPEVRLSDNRTPLERAQERDGQARTLDGVLKSSWAMLGLLVRDVERDRDWELLGFTSLNSWMLSALPYARSTAYDALALVKELAPDIPDEVLLSTSHDSAHILRQLSKSIRRDPKIQQAAQEQKPKDFRKKIATEYSDSHIELQVKKQLYFTVSQWDKVESAYEAFKVSDPTASLEVFIEWMVSEVEP